VPSEVNAWLSRRTDELELSVKTANALMHAGLETIGALVQKTESELLALKGFGPKSVQELKEILAELGLSLGMRT
jgi:DNA-directed RNA polymerase subunit alpha